MCCWSRSLRVWMLREKFLVYLGTMVLHKTRSQAHLLRRYSDSPHLATRSAQQCDTSILIQPKCSCKTPYVCRFECLFGLILVAVLLEVVKHSGCRCAGLWSQRGSMRESERESRELRVKGALRNMYAEALTYISPFTSILTIPTSGLPGR